ncbi:unnamed protein product [Orchesella dallaii]|uniref:Uncharacterized protein n=1 Tax=Orchesella dallaii TaxID=48710 RepID=A0ABP1RN19_9HEXA
MSPPRQLQDPKRLRYSSIDVIDLGSVNGENVDPPVENRPSTKVTEVQSSIEDEIGGMQEAHRKMEDRIKEGLEQLREKKDAAEARKNEAKTEESKSSAQEENRHHDQDQQQASTSTAPYSFVCFSPTKTHI